MIQYASGGKESFTGKRVAISGSGNVAQYAALKAIELGATIVSLSDSKGSIIANSEKGITEEDIAVIAQLKVDRKQLTELVNSDSHKDKFKYVEGARPWEHVGKVDIALPSATQNEVSKDEAQSLIEAGAKFIAEGSNMGCTQEAIDVFEENRKTKKGDAIWYAPGKLQLPNSSKLRWLQFDILLRLRSTSLLSPFPIFFPPHSTPPHPANLSSLTGKAANAGGVAVSGLEMAQNSQRMAWTLEEVDSKLKLIMENCFTNGLETAKKYVEPAEGEFPSLVAGSNIAGFSKVAAAMKAQGDWW